MLSLRSIKKKEKIVKKIENIYKTIWKKYVNKLSSYQTIKLGNDDKYIVITNYRYGVAIGYSLFDDFFILRFSKRSKLKYIGLGNKEILDLSSAELAYYYKCIKQLTVLLV
jgi:hypothetical protein